VNINSKMVRRIITRQFSEKQLAASPETRLWIDVLVLAIAEKQSDPLFFTDGRCQTVCAMIGMEYPVIEMIIQNIDELMEKERVALA